MITLVIAEPKIILVYQYLVMFFLLVVKKSVHFETKGACLKKTDTSLLTYTVYQMLPYFPLHVRKNLPRLPEDLPGIQAPLFKETEPFF